MSEYSYIDIALTVLAVLLAVRGFTRGFVKEFFSLGTPALGILGGFLFQKEGAKMIREANIMSDIPGLPEVLSFIAIFFIILIIGRAVRKILSDVINGMHLSSLDKLLGGIFGIVEGVAVIGLVLFGLSVQPLFDASALLDNSLYGTILLPIISKPAREGMEMLQEPAVLYLCSRFYFG